VISIENCQFFSPPCI